MTASHSKTTVRLTPANVLWIDHRKRNFGTPMNLVIQKAIDAAANEDATYRKPAKKSK